MAYMALYRKWRPMRLEEVRGQEPVVRTLRNQILTGRIGHAYLFCGTRGTGKTSVAKILARAVNCENPVSGSPCNECAVCRSILAGTSMDVAEIDAASNNGVDNIRDIREQVQYPPVEGRYRVYIIDEVHMLSAGAYNALLKTLEEPPAYVIFILATTEPNRLPVTVLSRCQRYDFRRITTDEIAGQIARLLAEEKVEAEDAAIRYIARAADGSMRDALSLLEECVSFFFGEKLLYEKVLEVLGTADTQVFASLTACLKAYNVSGCLRILDEASSQGKEWGQFALDLTWYFRCLMMVQTADEGAEAMEMSEDNYETLRQQAFEFSLDALMRNIRIASELSGQLKFAVSKRVLVETALIRMMQPAMDDDVQSLRLRLERLEEAVSSGIPLTEADAGVLPDKEAPARGPVRGRDGTGPEDPFSGMSERGTRASVVEISEAEYEDYERIRRDWNGFLKARNPVVSALLKGTRLTWEKGRGLVILFTSGIAMQAFLRKNRMEELGKQLAEEYHKEFSVSARLLEPGEKEPRVVRGKRLPGIEMDIEEE